MVLLDGKGKHGKDGSGGTYNIFLGLMTKHHRVQMAPVHMSAKFWVRESDSAGRAKSAAPARTSPHCCLSAIVYSTILLAVPVACAVFQKLNVTSSSSFLDLAIHPRRHSQMVTTDSNIQNHVEIIIGRYKHNLTFIIGAQKCTVFGPMGLFHSLTMAFSDGAAAVVCVLLAIIWRVKGCLKALMLVVVGRRDCAKRRPMRGVAIVSDGGVSETARGWCSRRAVGGCMVAFDVALFVCRHGGHNGSCWSQP